jgi:hypothetical protein
MVLIMNVQSKNKKTPYLKVLKKGALIALNQPVTFVPQITSWVCMTFSVLITPWGTRRIFD